MATLGAERKPLKVAIVHDWLIGGGAERVVLELHKLFPDAPIYTSYCTNEWRARLDNKVVTGWLQHFGFMRKFMVLGRMWWFTHLNLSKYDLVISSSGNGEAFSVRTGKNTTHICYCHTPTHYYWRNYDLYLKNPGFGALDPLARFGLRLFVKPLRQWDLKASRRPDYYIANSSHIQADIKKYYGRDSVVIWPPIDVDRFAGSEAKKRHGFITVGRQVPQKMTQLIVKACTKLGVPLTVIGNGPEHETLRQIAGPTVTFPKNVSDAEMGTYMASAEAFLFAAQDDFGVTPVEAMAAGTPVIAYKAGGAFDYVQEGKTGLFFTEQTVSSLSQAIQDFPKHSFNHAAIKKSATAFSPQSFDAKMTKLIDHVMQGKN
jgi:glycosyltransferase involved in cell wall biosynthesis